MIDFFNLSFYLGRDLENNSYSLVGIHPGDIELEIK